MMASISYALCALTSIVCLVFLLRGYNKSRTPLLLWSSFCFFFFAIQNGLLFIDLVLTAKEIDLSFWRTAAGLIGSAILLLGLIRERR